MFAEKTFALIPTTVTTTRGSILVGNSPTDTTFYIPTDVILSSDSFTISYRARLTDNVISSSNATTTTTLTFRSAPAAVARSQSVTVSTSVIIKPAQLALTLDSTSLPSTPGSHVTIGETATFLVTITPAKGLTTNPVLTITTGNMAILNAEVNKECVVEW